MLLWVLFKFDKVYGASIEMCTEVNMTVKIVCVATVVNREKIKV